MDELGFKLKKPKETFVDDPQGLDDVNIQELEFDIRHKIKTLDTLHVFHALKIFLHTLETIMKLQELEETFHKFRRQTLGKYFDIDLDELYAQAEALDKAKDEEMIDGVDEEIIESTASESGSTDSLEDEIIKNSDANENIRPTELARSESSEGTNKSSLLLNDSTVLTNGFNQDRQVSVSGSNRYGNYSFDDSNDPPPTLPAATSNSKNNSSESLGRSRGSLMATNFGEQQESDITIPSLKDPSFVDIVFKNKKKTSNYELDSSVPLRSFSGHESDDEPLTLNTKVNDFNSGIDVEHENNDELKDNNDNRNYRKDNGDDNKYNNNDDDNHNDEDDEKDDEIKEDNILHESLVDIPYIPIEELISGFEIPQDPNSLMFKKHIEQLPKDILYYKRKKIRERNSHILKQFNLVEKPNISIELYLLRFLKYSDSISVLVYIHSACLIYRLCVLLNVVKLTERNVHRFILALIRCLTKMLEDLYQKQKAFSMVGGVSQKDLFKTEVSFLFLCSFNVIASESLIEQFLGESFLGLMDVSRLELNRSTYKENIHEDVKME